jgi:hypothetical protein
MKSFQKGVGRSLGATLLIILCLGSLHGQQAAGGLRGRVVDERGAVIVGAKVGLTGSDGTEKTAATDAEGMYAFGGLEPGAYVLRVTALGFVPYQRPDVKVSPGRAALIDITLTVGLEKQEVNVESSAPVNTQPDANASAIVLRGADLDALPDDPEALTAALQALAGPAAGPDGGQVFVDGFSGARVPTKSSIREVRINQNPFSAEFDKLGFGRIEIVTKAGSSKYEGSGFFNFNDESLNARNPFAPSRAPFQVRRYGGNLSGPFLNKRGSFFLDFDRREVDDSAVVNATALDPGLNVTHISQALTVPQRRVTFSARFDRQLDPNNTLVGRYTYAGSRTNNAGVGDFSLASRAYNTSAAGQNVQVSETSVIRQKFINDFRFQFARESRRVGSDNSDPAVLVLDAFLGGGPQVGSASYKENRWELGDNLMFARGHHTLRVGARLRGVDITDVSPQNFGGTFTFAGGFAPRLEGGRVVLDANGAPVVEAVTSIERYRRTQVLRRQGLTPAQIRLLGGGASQFSISTGEPEAGVSQFDLGSFVQDDWALRPNLTLNFGLRYETQTNIADTLDFAPRVAFAWAPAAGGSKRPKTVLRGGFGLFYSRFGESLTLQARRFDGSRQRQFIVTDPSVIDSLPDRPSAADLAGFALPPTVRRVAADLRAPYSLQSALSLERQLPRNSTLTINYLNLHTLHVLRTRSLNAPPPGTAVPDAPGGLRSLAGVGNVYEYESSGIFNMSRLEVIGSTRFNRKVSLNAAYGLGSAKSDTDGVNSFPANPYDLSGEYGPSALDIRHRFFLTGSISAPWKLRFSPLVVVASGRPFNITTGRDANGDTLFTERPAFATDLTRPGVVVTPLGAFDLDPESGQKIIPRNYGRAPAFFAVSLRASRTFLFGAGGVKSAAAAPQKRSGAGSIAARRPAPEPRYTLNLSVQVWNLFNRANVNLPVGNLSSPLFGRPNSLAGGFGAGDPLSGSRLVDLQVRLNF